MDQQAGEAHVDTSADTADDDSRPGATGVQASPANRFWAIAFGWLMPRTAAKHLQGVSLAKAWVVHLLAAVIGALAMLAGRAWVFDTNNFIKMLGQIPRALRGTFVGEPLETLVVILLFEGAFVVFAFLLMPWGARDEKIRRSYAHALRFVWLSTVHLALLATIFVTFVNYCEHVHHQTWQTHGRSIAYPTRVPASRPANMTARDLKWQRAVLEVEHERYHRTWAEAEQQIPLIARYREVYFVVGFSLLLLWYLLALLRMIGSPRPVPKIDRHPMCEFCGYNLLHADPEGRCPECGALVLESLGEGNRPGALWERHRQLGIIKTFRLLPRRGQTDELGRSIRLTSREYHFASYFWTFIPLIAVVAYLVGAIIGTWPEPYYYAYYYSLSRPMHSVLVERGGTVAGVMTGLSLAIPLLLISLVGVVASIKAGRNLLPATMQIGAYSMNSFFVRIVAWLGIVLTLSWYTPGTGGKGRSALLLSFYAGLRQRTGLTNDEVVGVTILGLMIVIVLHYAWILWKGTMKARYANK
jgi:hypothetical protein